MDRQREANMKTQGEDDHLQDRERVLRRDQPYQHLDLKSSSLQNCEEISL